MVNRNAARHLLFVVSILLCFFIYMGYRLLGPKADDAETGPPAATVTSFTPETDEIASSDVSMPLTSPLRPVETPFDPESLPSVIQDDDDFSGWVPSPVADDLPMATTSDSSSFSSPGLTPPSSSSPGGAITGLIPAPPQEISTGQITETDSFSSVVPALPIPGSQAGSVAEMGLDEFDSSEPPVFLPPPGGDLKPPTSNYSVQGDFYSDATDDNSDDYVPSLPGVVGLPGTNEHEIANVTPLPEETPMRPIAPYSPPPPAGGNTPVPSAASLAPPTPELNTRPLPPELASPIPASAPIAPASALRPSGGAPAAVSDGRNQDASESLRIYVVRPGDTLSSIASNELGSVSLADNIFLLNRDVIADPDHLLVGIKIRLPIRDDHFGQGDGSHNNSPAAGIGRRPTYGIGRTHTVVRGETLSSIAQRYYGSSSAWRFLFEANKTIVPNPNTLSVGTELSIPPYEN